MGTSSHPTINIQQSSLRNWNVYWIFKKNINRSCTMWYLRWYVDIRPGGLPSDLDPVGQGGGGCLGPAAAAVLTTPIPSIFCPIECKSKIIFLAISFPLILFQNSDSWLKHLMSTELRLRLPGGCAGSLSGWGSWFRLHHPRTTPGEEGRPSWPPLWVRAGAWRRRGACGHSWAPGRGQCQLQLGGPPPASPGGEICQALRSSSGGNIWPTNRFCC